MESMRSLGQSNVLSLAPTQRVSQLINDSVPHGRDGQIQERDRLELADDLSI